MQILVNDGYQTCDCCGHSFRNGNTVVESTEGYYHVRCYREQFDADPEEGDLRKVVSE